MGRRSFLHRLAAAGVGVAAPGSPPAKAAPRLTVYSWAGYEDPALHERYRERYGESPAFDLFAVEEEALQRVRTGFTPDLIHPCLSSLPRWREDGLLQPIELGRIPNYRQVWPALQALAEPAGNGLGWFVPWDFGYAAILCRTDLLDPADLAAPSWGLMFEERYRGRLGVYRSDASLIAMAARSLGLAAPHALTDPELERVRPLVGRLLELAGLFWTDPYQVERALAAGEIVAAYAWNDSLGRLRRRGVPVALLLPKEGVPAWICGLVRHARAPGEPQAAYDFIDAMLDAEVGRHLIEQVGHGHASRAAYGRASPEALAGLGLAAPEAVLAAAEPAFEPAPKDALRYARMMARIRAELP